MPPWDLCWQNNRQSATIYHHDPPKSTYFRTKFSCWDPPVSLLSELAEDLKRKTMQRKSNRMLTWATVRWFVLNCLIHPYLRVSPSPPQSTTVHHKFTRKQSWRLDTKPPPKMHLELFHFSTSIRRKEELATRREVWDRVQAAILTKRRWREKCGFRMSRCRAIRRHAGHARTLKSRKTSISIRGILKHDCQAGNDWLRIFLGCFHTSERPPERQAKRLPYKVTRNSIQNIFSFIPER